MHLPFGRHRQGQCQVWSRPSLLLTTENTRRCECYSFIVFSPPSWYEKLQIGVFCLASILPFLSTDRRILAWEHLATTLLYKRREDSLVEGTLRFLWLCPTRQENKRAHNDLLLKKSAIYFALFVRILVGVCIRSCFHRPASSHSFPVPEHDPIDDRWQSQFLSQPGDFLQHWLSTCKSGNKLEFFKYFRQLLTDRQTQPFVKFQLVDCRLKAAWLSASCDEVHAPPQACTGTACSSARWPPPSRRILPHPKKSG